MMTLAELRDAYADGTLTEPLMLDNDETFVYDGSDEDGGTEVFSAHPDDLLEQCLDLLGIPHEHV